MNDRAIRHKLTPCPECDIVLDVSLAVEMNGSDAHPTEGNFSFCEYCGCLLRFNSSLSLCRLTQHEWTTLTIEDRTELTRLRRGMSLTVLLTGPWQYRVNVT